MDNKCFIEKFKKHLMGELVMNNAPGTVLITGVAPFSLGEAIAMVFLENFKMTRIIAVDRTINKRLAAALEKNYDGLENTNRGEFIVCDLNPLSYNRSDDSGIEFQKKFRALLTNALEKLDKRFHKKGIDILFSNAGVYEFGSVNETSDESISRVIGVNVLGHIYTLKSVMAINEALGFNNAEKLGLCEIGSFQGLSSRAGRWIYAPSKGFGLDMCQSLASAHELRQVVYLAAGPIDTPMLHYNHWLKAGGDYAVWHNLYVNRPEQYKSIFIGGEEDGLKEADDYDFDVLKEYFKKYVEIRNDYLFPRNNSTGIATAEEIAATAAKWMIGGIVPYPNSSQVVVPEVWFSRKDNERHYSDHKTCSLDLAGTGVPFHKEFYDPQY